MSTSPEDRFRLRGAFDRFFRHYARVGWLADKAGLPPTTESSWAVYSVLVDGADLEAAAKSIAVTRQDLQPLAGRLGRLKPDMMADPAMPQHVALECPESLLPPLLRRFGPELKMELLALNNPAPLDLRVNTLRATLPDASDRLLAEAIPTAPMPFSPIGLRVKGRPDVARAEAFTLGLVEVQDEGSQLVSLMTEARPGLQVLDFCAGSGGKSMALAAMMDNRGHLVAADASARRLARAKVRLKRAQVVNAERVLLGSPEGIVFLKRRKSWFDRVLVDAPCSGTGAWRRHPETRWQSGTNLPRLMETQDAVLDQAAPLVKRGGRLIYATCSLLPEENEQRVEAFLKRHEQFALLPAETIWNAALPVPWPCRSSDYLQLTPAQHGTDGFFAAILERRF